MQMGISLTKDTRGSQSTVHAAAEIQMSSCLLRTQNWLLIGCMVIYDITQGKLLPRLHSFEETFSADIHVRVSFVYFCGILQ